MVAVVGVLSLLVLFATSAYAQETVTLTVNSAYGSPYPPVGVYEYAKGTVITASVATPVAGGPGIRYACIGWKAKGSKPSRPGEIPAIGFTNSVTFTINSNVVLTWRWKAQYRLTLNVEPAGAGHIDFYCDSHPEEPSGTYPPDEGGYWTYLRVAQLQAVASEGYEFAYWSGGSQVLRLEPWKNPTVQKMRRPETITAHFVSVLAEFTICSAQGEPSPAVGIHQYYYDDIVTVNCGESPYPPIEGIQYECIGHTGTGDVADGPETEISFAIRHNSSVTWLWRQKQ
jgi:hypothetical protein